MGSSPVIHLDDVKSFDELIIKADKPVVVDFWAIWCPPCRIMEPIFEDVARELSGQAIFAKVNVDEGRSTATNFGIMSIPTLLLFKEGKIANQIVGVVSKGEIKSMIDEHLQS